MLKALEVRRLQEERRHRKSRSLDHPTLTSAPYSMLPTPVESSSHDNSSLNTLKIEEIKVII
jgi:hypothetical protein